MFIHLVFTNSPCFSQKTSIFLIISTLIFKKRYGFSIFLKAFNVYNLWFLDFWVVVEIRKMWCLNMGWVYFVEFVEWVLLILIIWCLFHMFSCLLLIFGEYIIIVLCCAYHAHSKMSQRQLLVIQWISSITLCLVLLAHSSHLHTTCTNVCHA